MVSRDVKLWRGPFLGGDPIYIPRTLTSPVIGRGMVHTGCVEVTCQRFSYGKLPSGKLMVFEWNL